MVQVWGKLLDIPISTGFGRSVHFEGQTFDIGYRHRNFAVEMHFIIAVYLYPPMMRRVLFWTTCKQFD